MYHHHHQQLARVCTTTTNTVHSRYHHKVPGWCTQPSPMQISIRLTEELLARIDAQGRPRQELIRAAIDHYLAHLARGENAEVIRRVCQVALLDQDGNVIKVL